MPSDGTSATLTAYPNMCAMAVSITLEDNREEVVAGEVEAYGGTSLCDSAFPNELLKSSEESFEGFLHSPSPEALQREC